MDNIYKLIVENLGEEIFVSDGDGNILFVNPASIEVNDLEADSVIGKNVKNLLEDGYFSDSSTLRVLEERKTISILQTLKDGRKVIATGKPVFDKDGEISMVISTSQDIEAVNHLLSVMETQDAEIESYREEIFSRADFITNDAATSEVQNVIKRIAPLEMPILIYGESGTGKSGIANSIHSFSNRKMKPVLSVNCTTAQEDLIEAELFGSETISGAGNVMIKKGKLELANEGTLIIHDIHNLPLNIQARLYNYIATHSFTRKNGSTSVESNCRIVASTDTDLRINCDKGYFRKDLYYALNTIPVIIPPLRDRPKDIPLIARIFLLRCNSKYHDNKVLGNKAMGVLASHDWPGNLIELEQVVESAYIMTDGSVISGETIYGILHSSIAKTNSSKILCTDIVPLKQAKHEVEKQLVKRAYEIYKTTYKAAEVLEVDQSTVVKILKKYKNENL